ncbi:TetR/AcrR family transcriptional regulator [Streptomyces sp. NPDC051636]|uniref:TetR/AcrR family transcriptional regulator n=1 Tax=Streptomyces sp. NPDC051636 TaxID=3365663 RepID=UPI0037A7D698
MADRGIRMSAEERRETIVRAAVAEFSRGGLHGTSTETIARRVGVSQPYLFRLFKGKQALFEAAADRCFSRMRDALTHAAEGLRGAEALAAMKRAQLDLLKDPEVLLMQLQVHAAAASPQQAALAKQVRRHWRELRALITSTTGATQDELDSVLAQGALHSALAAVDLPPSGRS